MMPAYISEGQIAKSADWLGLIAYLRQAHQQIPAQVQRLLMQQASSSGDDNGLLIWPAWQAGHHLGVKICTVFPANQHRPTVQALYVLLDGQDGHIQALLDGTEMTYWKTAADSALGADYLARHDATTLLMVGAGRLAPYLIKAYRAIRPGIRSVKIWNRTLQHAHALAAQLTDQDGIEVVQDLGQAVATADIVCCATASTTPLIQGVWLQPGTHVDLIGGFTPTMREADDVTIQRARVFVDSRSFTLAHVGDLTQPLASGVLKVSEVLGDLFDLCSARVPGRQTAQDITLFKSGGGAHLDLMTAQYLFERLGS